MGSGGKALFYPMALPPGEEWNPWNGSGRRFRKKKRIILIVVRFTFVWGMLCYNTDTDKND